MKRASIRQLQHHLSEVMRYIDHGEEVLITRRNRVVAKLVPASVPPESIEWPDFLKRAMSIAAHPGGKAASEIVIDNRRERF